MDNELQKESLDSENYSGMELSRQAIESLAETRKWAAFVSIVGFVFLAILVLIMIASLFMTSLLPYSMGMVTGPFIAIMFLIIIAIYFFPIYFLYQFSAYSKKAIHGKSVEDMDKAMYYLKLHYRYMGILMIVILAIYLLIFIFGGLATLFFR
jgi:hypothetical protein